MKKLLCLLLVFMLCGCSIDKRATTKTVDVSPYLYKISDNNNHYLYLLGTCHPGRDQIDKLDITTEKAIKDSQSIVLECSLDQNETAKYQNYLLENSLGELDLINYIPKLKENYPTLKKYRVNEFNAMAVSSLVTSDILDEVDGNNSTSIDAYLFNLTRSKKIPFEEMEGIEFQMQLFSQLSKESPHAILESLKDRQQLIKSTKLILDSYYNHDLDTLATIYSYQELPDNEYQQEYQNYQQLLIIDRNQTMQAKIIEYLNQNKVVFIGVGVGHVVGYLGLITSLSAAGYKVEKLG